MMRVKHSFKKNHMRTDIVLLSVLGLMVIALTACPTPVESPSVTGITITGAGVTDGAVSRYEGDQNFYLIAEVTGINNPSQSVTWASLDKNVSTVETDSGEVKIIASGTVIITATSVMDMEQSASITLTVIPAPYPEVIADRDKLGITFVVAEDTAESVTGNINLPTTGAGTNISWRSGNEAAITNDGIVTRQNINTRVVLWATLSHKTATGSNAFKEFILTVIADPALEVEADKSALNIDFVDTGDTVTSITNNLTLTPTGVNTDIVWISNNANVISNFGIVSRTANDEDVKLTARLTHKTVVDVSATKEFTLTVLADPILVVEADKNNLDIDFSGADMPNSVTGNLNLQTEGTGTNISWVSNNATAINNVGVVTRAASDVEVKLTATLSHKAVAGVSATKEFTLTVIADPILTRRAEIAIDKAALSIGFANGDNENSVTSNLTLPTHGTYTNISWISGTSDAVTVDGTVTRLGEDKSVILFATLTHTGDSNIKDTKQFSLTVIANPATELEADKNALAIGFVNADDIASMVTGNLILSISGTNSTIRWSSDDTNTMTDEGIVTRSASDTTVKLTATLTHKEIDTVTTSKEFILKVTADPTLKARAELVADKDALLIGYATGDDASSVTSNLVSLPSSSTNTNIVWTSNNAGAMTSSGIIHRSANDVSVKFTATLTHRTRTSVTDTREFTLTVKADPIQKASAELIADRAILSIGYIVDDSANSVTSNLTSLPTSGSNTNITWSSGNEAVMTNDGVITRSTRIDVNVVLTATLTHKTVTTVVGTKVFTLTIKLRSYAIGEIGPGTGKVFYDKGSYSDGWRYLEVALDDISTVWGGEGTAVEGTSTAIGQGQANTVIIVNTLGSNNSLGYAAKICDDLVLGGQDDWFMPSKDELNELYTNRNLVGLDYDYTTVHWSSSIDGDNADKGCYQSLYSGVQNTWLRGDGGLPTDDFNVHAVRDF